MRWLLIALTIPFSSGCIAYGHPSVCRIPQVNVAEEGVRAFRVTFDWIGDTFLEPASTDHEVVELPVVAGKVEAQLNAYFDYCWWIGLLHRDRTMEISVRLYRRGFETVEIPEQFWFTSLVSPIPSKTEWEPASSLEAQEKALRKIIGPGDRETCLSKEVLEFAATEYAHLAASPLAQSASTDERIRLEKEAREYAERLAKLNSKGVDLILTTGKEARKGTTSDSRNTAGTH